MIFFYWGYMLAETTLNKSLNRWKGGLSLRVLTRSSSYGIIQTWETYSFFPHLINVLVLLNNITKDFNLTHTSLFIYVRFLRVLQNPETMYNTLEKYHIQKTFKYWIDAFLGRDVLGEKGALYLYVVKVEALF